MPAAKKKVVKKKVAKKKTAAKKTVVKKLKALPKTAGGIIDALFTQDQVIRGINVALTEAKQQRERMVEHAFTVFKNDDLEGGRGKLAQCSISRNVVPQVEDPADWPKLFRWILKTKDFSVLQKRLGVTHIRDLWDDKKKVPGVVPFTKIGLSVTKVKAK